MLPGVSFVLKAVGRPTYHSVKYGGLFVVFRARPEAVRLLEFVEAFELLFKSIQVSFRADSS